MYGNSPSLFGALLKQYGQLYSVERNSKIVSELTGMSNRETSTVRAYVGFIPGSDIKPGDWIINSVGERFYIEDTITDFAMKNPIQLKAFYLTEKEFNSRQQISGATVFNIGTANGSVIGTQSVVHMSYNDTIQNAKAQIENSTSPDKEDLKQIITLLEMIVNNQVPATKGLFSRFSEVMERNSWITSSISSTLLSWLMSRFQ